MIKINEYVEALIFSFGDGISLEEIVKRTKSDPIMVKKAVNDLNKAYSERKSAFYILTEGNLYRMRLRSDLLYLVQDNLRIDMSRGVLMTLSLIVLNGKIKQADLVKKRGSISYQHVKELQSRELVSTAVEDGKKVIKITPSFYDYFDVDKKEEIEKAKINVEKNQIIKKSISNAFKESMNNLYSSESKLSKTTDYEKLMNTLIKEAKKRIGEDAILFMNKEDLQTFGKKEKNAKLSKKKMFGIYAESPDEKFSIDLSLDKVIQSLEENIAKRVIENLEK